MYVVMILLVHSFCSVPDTGLAFFSPPNSLPVMFSLKPAPRRPCTTGRCLYFNYLSFCILSLLDSYIQGQRSHFIMNKMQHDTMEDAEILQLNRLSHFTGNETED